MTETKISLDLSIKSLEAVIAQNEDSKDAYTRGVVFGYRIALQELKRAREVMQREEYPVTGCPF